MDKIKDFGLQYLIEERQKRNEALQARHMENIRLGHIPERSDGEPCSHPGCLHHYLSPCEGCGRIAGRRSVSKDRIHPAHYFQDDKGIVYKTEEIEGKFVYFDPVEIKRTKREGETRGSLSVKEATENGFTV